MGFARAQPILLKPHTACYIKLIAVWTRKRNVAETQGSWSVSKALNAAWVRPFLFLIFIIVAWDLTIRLFQIPAYQIPAPADVVAVLWSDWPELLRQTWPTTYATVCGFLLSAVFGILIAMLIA